MDESEIVILVECFGDWQVLDPLGRIQINLHLDKEMEHGPYQINEELILIMRHRVRYTEITFDIGLQSGPQLLGMAVVDHRILSAVDKQHFCVAGHVLYGLQIIELLLDEAGEEAEFFPGDALDRGVAADEDRRVRLVPPRQVDHRPSSQRATHQNYVSFLQIIELLEEELIDSFRVLANLQGGGGEQAAIWTVDHLALFVFVRRPANSLVYSISGVLGNYNTDPERLPDFLKQIVAVADVLGIGVEKNDELRGAAVQVRQVQARDVLI